MTITQAAKAKAVELANTANLPGTQFVTALARVLQEHSDVAKAAREYGVDEKAWDALAPLILPGDPDPLEEALAEALPTGMGRAIRPIIASDLRAALDAAGYQITRKPTP